MSLYRLDTEPRRFGEALIEIAEKRPTMQSLLREFLVRIDDDYVLAEYGESACRYCDVVTDGKGLMDHTPDCLVTRTLKVLDDASTEQS